MGPFDETGKCHLPRACRCTNAGTVATRGDPIRLLGSRFARGWRVVLGKRAQRGGTRSGRTRLPVGGGRLNMPAAESALRRVPGERATQPLGEADGGAVAEAGAGFGDVGQRVLHV